MTVGEDLKARGDVLKIEARYFGDTIIEAIERLEVRLADGTELRITPHGEYGASAELFVEIVEAGA